MTFISGNNKSHLKNKTRPVLCVVKLGSLKREAELWTLHANPLWQQLKQSVRQPFYSIVQDSTKRLGRIP